jgi:branched-chain amino acid transport system permease protein
MHLKYALKDAALVGVLALLLFLPMTGIALAENYSFNARLHVPFLLAGMVMLGRFIFSYALHTYHSRQWVKRLIHREDRPRFIPWVRPQRRWILLALFVFGLVLPFTLSNYGLNTAILALIYVLLGLGLNIVVGLAGLLDLGFVAFYAVGAYTFALGGQYFGLGFWGAIPVAAAIAALCGVLLGFPVLRLHGDYLAIVTLGFGEIIRLILTNWIEVTGGPNGVQVPTLQVFGFEFTRIAKAGGVPIHEYLGVAYSTAYRYWFLYLVLFLVVCAMIFILNRLRSLPIGRAWEALREDEIACRSLGINPVTVKLSAFSMGAMVGGVAGVFFAAQQGFINPTSFTFFESALILAIVVLGGMGSTLGVVLAAIVLTLLPEVLREFSQYRIVLFGGLMVLMMVWRPRGFISLQRRQFKGAA